jgi:hypothetical protein
LTRRRPASSVQLLAQVLRRRLPTHGALGSLGERDFCALVPGASQLEIEGSLAAFTYPHVKLDMPGIHMDLTLDLAFGLAFPGRHEVFANPATELWATVVAGLKD